MSTKTANNDQMTDKDQVQIKSKTIKSKHSELNLESDIIAQISQAKAVTPLLELI